MLILQFSFCPIKLSIHFLRFDSMNVGLANDSIWFKSSKLSLDDNKNKCLIFHTLSKRQLLPKTWHNILIENTYVKRKHVTKKKLSGKQHHASVVLLKLFYNNRLYTVTFLQDNIGKIIQNLKPKKTHDYNNISIRMLKICGSSIYGSLELILKDTLRTGLSPSNWKKGNIVPIHK